MLPTAVTQLLIALLLVLFWLQWYRHCKTKSLRDKQSRDRVAAQSGFSSELDDPPPKAVLIEQESANKQEADSTLLATEEPEATRIPTGITCVVRAGRKLLRCTEFEDAGELKTEVVRVNKRGHTMGNSFVRSGSFRSVANELLSLNSA